MSATEILHEMVFEGTVPAKHVADQLGTPYSTLQRQCNPFDEGAKVGVDMLVPIMQATRSTKILDYLAAQVGKRVVGVSAKPDGRNMDHECNQASIALGKFLDAIDQGTPSKDTHDLMLAAVKEIEDCWVRQRNEEARSSVQVVGRTAARQ